MEQEKQQPAEPPTPPTLLEAASRALAYFNLLGMRYCDDAPHLMTEFAPIRTMLCLAISKTEGRVIGGNIPDMEAARQMLDSQPPASELAAALTPEVIDLLNPIAPKPMLIDLTPAGCKTTEGAAKVAKHLDEWNASAHEVANAVQHFLDAHGADVRQVLRQHGDFGAALEDLHQITALVGARSRKQDAFLRALCGR